jgi:UPF0042 nucleotide-binding protein
MTATASSLVIVSGLSGSGKSVALRTLEDLGFYCVDNLPANLLPELVQNMAADDLRRHRIAVGIDVRNLTNDLRLIGHLLTRVRTQGFETKLVFFDTDDAVLIKRFSETRRKHPLSMQGLPLSDAIAEERRQLQPLVALADLVVDTTALNVHQLRKRMPAAAFRSCSNPSPINAACRRMPTSYSTHAVCRTRIGFPSCGRCRARMRR